MCRCINFDRGVADVVGARELDQISTKACAVAEREAH